MFIQRTQRNNRTLIIRGFLIVAALFVLWRFGVVRTILERTVFMAATPLWRAEQYVLNGLAGRSSFFKLKQSLARENELLKEKNVFLNAELYTLPIIKKESQELKEILGRRSSFTKLILARVLVRPGRSPYDTVVVDRGSKDGIEAGNIATIYGDVAIGRVERVYPNSSVVKLFSSPGEEIGVLLGEGNIPITAHGRGGGNFKADVPKGVLVKEGDAVIFPVGETPLVGIVEFFHSASGDSFQSVLFQIPINIYEMKWVEILLESGYPPVERGEE